MVSEPSRVLFPLGAMLAGAGVAPWVAFSLDLPEVYRPIFQSIGYRSIFHPLVEIEGALSCVAAGYLFTAVPEKTRTPGPHAWQTAVAVLAPIGTVICAFTNRWALAQAFWIALVAVAVEFAARRTAAWRDPPAAIWLAAGLAMGVAGGVLGALANARSEWLWLHEAGRGLLLQGLLTGLVLGASGALVGARVESVALHVIGAVIVFASFFGTSPLGQRIGYGVRAAVALAILALPLYRTREQVYAGLRQRLTRLSMWMLPIGLGWAAVAPAQRRAGLHVVYLGSFVTLAVVLASFRSGARAVRMDELALTAGLVGVALVARIMLELDPRDFHLWLGFASGAFVFAAPLWALLARP